jgi:hypothetical protein
MRDGGSDATDFWSARSGPRKARIPRNPARGLRRPKNAAFHNSLPASTAKARLRITGSSVSWPDGEPNRAVRSRPPPRPGMPIAAIESSACAAPEPAQRVSADKRVTDRRSSRRRSRRGHQPPGRSSIPARCKCPTTVDPPEAFPPTAGPTLSPDLTHRGSPSRPVTGARGPRKLASPSGACPLGHHEHSTCSVQTRSHHPCLFHQVIDHPLWQLGP